MDFTLYNFAISAADKYKQLDREFTDYVQTIEPFNPPYEYFTRKNELMKAKKEFEKADKKWKEYYSKNVKETHK